MKYRDCMIVWTANFDFLADRPTFGKIKVVPYPDNSRLSHGYFTSVGACYSSVRDLSELEQKLQMMLDFHTAVVRDGIDPKLAHEAFLNIDEYRGLIAHDIPGADND